EGRAGLGRTHLCAARRRPGNARTGQTEGRGRTQRRDGGSRPHRRTRAPPVRDGSTRPLSPVAFIPPRHALAGYGLALYGIATRALRPAVPLVLSARRRR